MDELMCKYSFAFYFHCIRELPGKCVSDFVCLKRKCGGSKNNIVTFELLDYELKVVAIPMPLSTSKSYHNKLPKITTKVSLYTFLWYLHRRIFPSALNFFITFVNAGENVTTLSLNWQYLIYC